MRRLFCWAFAVALTGTAQIPSDEQQTKARDLFLTVERTARLPVAEENREIPRIYRDVWPVLEFEPSIAVPDLHAVDERGTPEELAARFEQQPGGWTIVVHAARVRCRRLLAEHAKQVEGLAREDLESKDRKRIYRGLGAAAEFKLTGLYDAVVPQLDGAEPGRTAYALQMLDDPRAIPALVQHGIMLYFERLRVLERGRPADSGLEALLNAKDADVRWRAAYALAESGDPSLVPAVERLARDEFAQVREQAANIGFGLSPGAFNRVRPALVTLLADKAVNVKSSVAIQFAQRKDAVCAKALYELLEDEEKLEPWQQSNVVEAVNNVTGYCFGFEKGTISREPARRASLARFAQWISSTIGPDRSLFLP